MLKLSFTTNQFDRAANIFDNAGQVILAVAVLAPVISGFDRTSWFVVISGAAVTIFCWILSLWLSKKGE